MTMHQIIDTVRGAFQDPDIGLTPRIDALADPRLRSDFLFVPWKLQGSQGPLSNTTQPNIAVMPDAWDVEPGESDAGHRDADARVRIAGEYFDADPAVLEENVMQGALAAVQVIAQLRAYSDTHGGTIIDVFGKIIVRMGEFPGATSGGFTVTFTLEERGTV